MAAPLRFFPYLAVSLALSLGSVALAQDQVVPQVPNAPQQFAGAINASAVTVRSGPGENYYPTMKLEKGAQVTVVGISFEWLKIVPPEGSFSVVAKTFVTPEADGRTGRVNADVNVRAGSSLNSLKYAVQGKLSRGETVTILGEQDEYYKIAPPPGAFLYVHQRYVDPVRKLSPGEMLPPAPAAPRPSESAASSSAETTPAEQTAAAAPTAEQLAEERALAEFDRLEAAVRAASQRPLEEQPLADLLGSYDRLIKGGNLPPSARRMSELRVLSLKARLSAQEQLLATRRQQEESARKLAALEAQRSEIESRLLPMTVYTAVGKLLTSTVQSGEGTLYRLVDPATERTICYVRSTEPRHISFLGQFVGVNGELGSDPALSLRTVRASEVVPVDSARINRDVAAKLVPPSLLSQRQAGEPAQTLTSAEQ